jgi:hypothetical protein
MLMLKLFDFMHQPRFFRLKLANILPQMPHDLLLKILQIMGNGLQNLVGRLM